MNIHKKTLEQEIDNFDLLITFKKSEEISNDEINTIEPEIIGLEEIEKALNNTESLFYIKSSEFFDVVTVDLDLKPAEAIELFKKTPTIAIEKVIPIDLVVPTLKETIINDVLKLASEKMNNSESFTVKCKLRNKIYLKSSEELIHKISNEICEKLNVIYDDKNANWVIIIEELGKIAGIGICRNEHVLIK